MMTVEEHQDAEDPHFTDVRSAWRRGVFDSAWRHTRRKITSEAQIIHRTINPTTKISWSEDNVGTSEHNNNKQNKDIKNYSLKLTKSAVKETLDN